MTRFLKKLAIATTIAIVVGAGLSFLAYYTIPGFLFEWGLDRALVDAGGEFETVEVEGEVFEYAVGGDGQAIVMVHGFGGDKRVWTPYFGRLAANYRIVAPDLPGHGGSSASADQAFNLTTMGEALARFVESRDLPRFHLVGISMGGGVALSYALEHPERVTSLTLLNPWGVTTPKPSEREIELERGHNVFFPETLEQLDELSVFTYGVPLPVEGPFAEYLLEEMQRRADFNRRVFDGMLAGPRLDEDLQRLKVPTLVIVGGADRVVHPSSLEVYGSRVPDFEGEELPGCAHILVGPCFDRALARFEQFLHR